MKNGEHCPRRLLTTNKNVKHVIDDVAMIITRHTTLDKGTPVSEGTPGTTQLHLGTTASVLKVCTRILRNGGIWHQQRRIGGNNDMFLAMNARAPETTECESVVLLPYPHTDARQPDHLSANKIRAP